MEGGGLTQLLQQKTLVEAELWELKAQLEKAGFTSLSQMRSDDDVISRSRSNILAPPIKTMSYVSPRMLTCYSCSRGRCSGVKTNVMLTLSVLTRCCRDAGVH